MKLSTRFMILKLKEYKQSNDNLFRFNLLIWLSLNLLRIRKLRLSMFTISLYMIKFEEYQKINKANLVKSQGMEVLKICQLT